LYRLLFLDLRDLDLEASASRMQLIKAAKVAGIMVILIVSDVRSSNIRYVYSLGLGGYVCKPLTKRKLAHAIIKAKSRSANLPDHNLSTSPSDRDQKVAILLADDSFDNRILIQSYLKHA